MIRLSNGLTIRFNPWRGCTKVSPGCANCYAETMSKRNPSVLGVWGDGGTRVVASEAMWREPVKWDKAAKAAGERHRVFCASLADVCEDRNDLIEPRIRLKRLIEATPNLDWLLLTKRPEQYQRLFYGPGCWPRNVWVGTSVEDQKRADERIPHLPRVDARVRFLSCEPLLGPIGLDEHLWYVKPTTRKNPALCWVIVGGESGGKARPFDIAWARSIRDQCRAAGVACFIKQLGAAPILEADCDPARGVLLDSHGGDMDEWPDDLRVREFPNSSADTTPRGQSVAGWSGGATKYVSKG